MLRGLAAEDQIKVYRTKSQLVICVLAVVAGNAINVIALANGVDGTSSLLARLLFSIALTVFGLRAAFSAVVTTTQGVRVSNAFASHSLDWSDIEKFGLGRWKLLPYVCLIYLRDGTLIHGLGVEESTRLPDGTAEEMIDELNRELREHRAAMSRAGVQFEAQSLGGRPF